MFAHLWVFECGRNPMSRSRVKRLILSRLDSNRSRSSTKHGVGKSWIFFTDRSLPLGRSTNFVETCKYGLLEPPSETAVRPVHNSCKCPKVRRCRAVSLKAV